MKGENIRVQGLSTGYSSGRSAQRVISRNLNLSISQGEMVMLMGPNGSGKSTLMHTMAGLLPSFSGDILISGQSISQMKMKDRARQLSLVLTERILVDNMTVWDVVVIGRHPHTGYLGHLSVQDRLCIEEAIGVCNLEGMEDRPFGWLSDGEKQRVLIARALAQETPLILLDEPTAHLDLPSRLEVVLMLRNLARLMGKSILISTHELDLALGWADTIWLMDRSGQISSASPEDLVLQGEIERVFGSDKLSYDSERAEFSVQLEQARHIVVQGQGLRYLWTLKALKRVGFLPVQVDCITTPRVLVKEDLWLLHTEDASSQYHSITALLEALGDCSQKSLSPKEDPQQKLWSQ
ncbi:ABC transporter ATP-binding protein [Porphyromonas sp. COT-290 OH3588]|uniref:ABC transporter ATP-binding protein n=1 Tax=Porphyromonas sp. COT-290 OH3588 TaxID=1515617 RepID=UPI0005C586D0|nr:ABC transporter ATP-binding protein [Porphyromonas sp. COT-290 OH3588]